MRALQQKSSLQKSMQTLRRNWDRVLEFRDFLRLNGFRKVGRRVMSLKRTTVDVPWKHCRILFKKRLASSRKRPSLALPYSPVQTLTALL